MESVVGVSGHRDKTHVNVVFEIEGLGKSRSFSFCRKT